jgi:transcriptional regulator with XRE-family HTH domain
MPSIKPTQSNWTKLLSSETELALQEVGRLISVARKQRKISVIELAGRIGVDRRTVAQLEKGSPTVSVGVFFQTLHALDLLRGIEEVVRPENDLEAISGAVRKVRHGRSTSSPKIDDKKVDF